jgi:hypothetical protein
VQPYSPERRTALVLSGTGAHGAYHAGALRALQEAGVKIDVMAGHGIGAGAAALAAIDGGARLWDEGGVWRSPEIARSYAWKWPLLVAAGLTVSLAAATVVPLFFAADTRPAFVVWLPALLALALVLVVAGAPVLEQWNTPPRRRMRGQWWWRVLGAPLDATNPREQFRKAIAQLVSRKYSEVLNDSLGQPGFRELMIVTADLDTRRDIVGALLREPYAREFMTPRTERERRAEAIDLAGAGREHALDLMAAAMTPPVACEPYLLTFPADSYWRGETHRLCDRPGASSRLLEELAAAGVSQAIIVSAVSPHLAPHRLTASPLDPRRRLGDFIAAAESASLRDAMEMARLRFDSVYLICPSHNPVGPFDFRGAYDDASDRRQELLELMDRAYDDAYRQFIEPVVGASGEHLARVTAPPGREYPSILDDAP